ncbi:putative HAT dimerization domain-containing protein [Helianthus debilis subsp. tardiflorus]
MTKLKSKKQALFGNFFKRKYEEINDDDTIPPNETTPSNVDVDSSPNVDNDNIQANDDVDASPNVDNYNPTSSIPTTRVYRVVKLALLLPVAIATVERCFSKLKLVKTDLRNRISPEFLNNAMVCAVEKNFLSEFLRRRCDGSISSYEKKKGTNLLGIFLLYLCIVVFL